MPNSQQKCWQASGRLGEDKIKTMGVITWFEVGSSRQGDQDETVTGLLTPYALPPTPVILTCFPESSCIYSVAQTTLVRGKIFLNVKKGGQKGRNL